MVWWLNLWIRELMTDYNTAQWPAVWWDCQLTACHQDQGKGGLFVPVLAHSHVKNVGRAGPGGFCRSGLCRGGCWRLQEDAGRCRLASFCKVIGKTNLPNASGLEALTWILLRLCDLALGPRPRVTKCNPLVHRAPDDEHLEGNLARVPVCGAGQKK